MGPEGYGVGIWGWGGGCGAGIWGGDMGPAVVWGWEVCGSSLGSHWVLFGVLLFGVPLGPFWGPLQGHLSPLRHPMGPPYRTTLWGRPMGLRLEEKGKRNPTALKPHSRPTSPFIHRAGGIWGFGFLSVMCGVGWVWGLGWRGLWGGFGGGLGWLWGWV